MKNNSNNSPKKLQELDTESKKLGMGGYIKKGISDEKYQQRMEKRKEVQKERLTQRNLEKGLIIVFTGHGKGKTTAALGMGIRTLGYNEKIAIIQFIKGGWEPGESKSLKNFGDKVIWHALGEGFTWETQNRSRDKELVSKAWDKAMIYIKSKEYKLVILDEINIAIKLDYISVDTVIQGIRERPYLTHVVLTGRDASQELIKIADLATEMKLLRHPFKEQGIKAQPGIEY